MTARNEILSKLRRQIVNRIDLPEVIRGDWIEFDDPVEQFRKSIEMAGGLCSELSHCGELSDRLAQYPQWTEAKRIFSGVPEVPGTVDLSEVDDPHHLESLDFVVYWGQFAVAENGAIWLTDHDLRHRVVFFITQFLVLVVRKDSIVQNMHQAYARAQMPSPGFGVFLSGPSKTADIEQSLVIGAHGCRELQVYLV